MSGCPYCMKLVFRRTLQTDAKLLQKVKYKHYEVSSTPQPKENVDFVSPPNPDSNIRKVVYSKARSRDEEDLNSERWQTNLWNDDFWKNHNKKFFKEKKEFIEQANAASGTGQEVADKLSVFYKEFLEKNHETYMTYNREWYRRNFHLLWMSMRTSLFGLLQRSVPSTSKPSHKSCNNKI